MSTEKEISNPQAQKKDRQFNTDGGLTKSNAIEVPSITLPKGGGAIKGIDQKFTVNAVNGTAAFSIPLPVSAARGATPSLSVSYNSGGGNGIFGLGWSLNLPSIKRKTDKKLPQYHDYDDPDTYLLSEAEDLVPEFARYTSGTNEGEFIMSGNNFVFLEDNTIETGWTIRYYKPRIEGLFARIERWMEDSTGQIKWRVFSKDNTITLYGWSSDNSSRICDPAKPERIYEWLPEMVIDDKGNLAIYKYSAEDATGIDMTLLHNKNRYDGSSISYTNLYLDKILYGNKTPFAFGDTEPSESDFIFQTIFDYGQYNPSAPYDLSSVWDFRADPFSDYKSGFEIRTTRLCKRVLLFHFFPDLIDGSALVKSLDFGYDDNDNVGFTFLNSITSKGYIKLTSTTYSSKSLPAVEFTYQAHDWNNEVKEISSENLLHAPVGLNQPYQFTDLYNEGLPGILSEQAGAWFYKRNNGEGNFEAAHMVSPKPSFSGIGGALQLLDLDGDGVKQIVNYNSNPKGFFELNDDEEFQRFKYFDQLPNINLNDPNARLIDLNGDGKTDVLITEDTFFTWYESDGRNGFKERYRTPLFFDEEQGPKLVFADQKQTIFLADMSGDGLVDIVRIRNGEVCYWPNLGYGNFGAKVGMDNAPVFDTDNEFNPAYLKISDIDGSGTPDIIYLGKNKFTCWLNLSGNAYSTSPYEITAFPQVHNHADISIADLLGNGLSCIVWSSSLQKDTSAPLRYIDLMNSKKPHIMMKHINNMGKEVELEYTPSTKYYINDKLAGKPWATKLHFPVYCLSKITTKDKITGHVFTNNYSYHHGYYDHAEKEFRGFGRVDQTDTETFDHWTATGTNLNDATVNQAPILTRSWFHTGAWIRDKKILNQFESEYWYSVYNTNYGPYSSVETPLSDARIVPDGLNTANQLLVDNMNPIEHREAFRACKSLPLRIETFALEGTAQEQSKPISVSTHTCLIELLQPAGQNKNAVFCVKESETLNYYYDRNIDDPRIAHNLNLSIDIYGNVLKAASIVYPRLVPDTGLPTLTQNIQAKTLITYTENTLTNDVIQQHNYRLRLPFESISYEITGLTKAGDIYAISEFDNILTNATAIPYEQLTPGTGLKSRMIEHVKSLYYKDDLTGALADGVLESKGLPFENYQLAYTENTFSDLIDDVFNATSTRVTGVEMLFGEYESISNDWWIRSGTIQYISGTETVIDAENRFFVPVSFTDPFGSVTTVNYDTTYYLFVEQTTDAVGNVNTVNTFDYRTLSPAEMQDMNNNISAVILDELGFPKAMALYGKGTQADDLTGLTAETLTTEQTNIDDYFNEADADITDSDALQGYANTLLQHATVRFMYDLHRYVNSSGADPVVVSSIAREEHYQDNNNSPIQISFEYSSGSGAVVMKKIQAEKGLAKQVVDNNNGTITVISRDTTTAATGTPFPALRWIGNGRTVVNNKGNVVKQYEPFFSVTAKYESTIELVDNGVTAINYYDAQNRLVKTDFPDGTFTKTIYNSWKQTVYDQNDTSTDSAWYIIMQGGSTEEIDASDKAANHYDTPKSLHFDTLGRVVLEQEMLENSTPTIYNTLLEIDIEGNLRSVTDARNNTPMQYKYDMLGHMVYQLGMDSGERFLLHDCMGAPLRTWDQIGHEVQFTYDALHRPETVKVIGGPNSLNNKVEKFIYGEGQTNDQLYNLRGKLYQHYDTGGLEEMATYDFKGNALSTERWLAADYKNVVDWDTPSTLETTGYTISTNFDALNRIKDQTAPDGSLITPTYSERGVLYSEDVDQGSGNVTHLKEVHYDAKGQRSKVKYGNDTYTNYTYDENSFRLKRLLTKNNGGDVFQDQNFYYDAVGNITWKRDDAIPNTFYNNDIISGDNTYTYDGLYRLIEATGRESLAAATFGTTDNYSDSFHKYTHSPSDSMAMQTYTQYYEYDEVGNITQLQHDGASVGDYTRTYTYSTSNNRLTKTTIGATDYNISHNTDHGFIDGMPHLSVLEWNWKEEVVATSKQAYTTPNIPETTYYQYDSKGKRLRKITENYAAYPATPTQKNQRIYIEGYEFYEDFGTSDTTETLSLIDEGRRFVMIENSSVSGLLTRYQHPNHQSSCTLETDENGDIITYEEYHPFGTTSYQAKNATITASAKRYRYTGMERDEETGLSYHNARYYITWLGRWMNPDPIGIGDGVNVYAYCHNDPVGNKDVRGTQTDEKKTEGIFPANPKDGQQFVHYNKEQNTNWGYVYDKEKGWIGTGAAANLNTVEVTASATPRSVFTGGPLKGQPLPSNKSETTIPIGTYYEGMYEFTFSTNLRPVTNENSQNISQLRYLGKPTDSQIMERAVQLSNDLMIGGEYNGFGLNTKGDASIKYKATESQKLNISVNLIDPSLKSIGQNSLNVSTTNISYGPASFVNKTETVSDPPMQVVANGVVTGTIQYSFEMKTVGMGYVASTEKNTVIATESFTRTSGQVDTRTVGRVTTRFLGGSIGSGPVKVKLNIPMTSKTEYR